MPVRLHIIVMLCVVTASAGCASSPLRPLRWWRHRNAISASQVAAASAETEPIETLSAAPPKLPAGIELPPEPTPGPATLPSGATEQIQSEAGNTVIFASAGQ